MQAVPVTLLSFVLPVLITFRCSLAHKPDWCYGVIERAGCGPCGTLVVLHQAHAPSCLPGKEDTLRGYANLHALIVIESDQSESFACGFSLHSKLHVACYK